MSLAGQALLWFRQLPARSIDNFHRLCEAFITRYICNRKQQKNTANLFLVKQLDNEPLKAFLERFTSEMQLVDNCYATTAAMAFVYALV